MSVWIFLVRVAGEKETYYYDIDKALETLPKRTIYQVQGRITSIEVGDIVYFYECDPVKAIGWKCRVLSVKVPYEKTADIDESEFEHGKSERDDYYIKVTALAKYDGESRFKLSLSELHKNGLKPKTIRAPFRPQGELLSYINSIKPSVKYDD